MVRLFTKWGHVLILTLVFSTNVWADAFEKEVVPCLPETTETVVRVNVPRLEKHPLIQKHARSILGELSDLTLMLPDVDDAFDLVHQALASANMSDSDVSNVYAVVVKSQVSYTLLHTSATLQQLQKFCQSLHPSGRIESSPSSKSFSVVDGVYSVYFAEHTPGVFVISQSASHYQRFAAAAKMKKNAPLLRLIPVENTDTLGWLASTAPKYPGATAMIARLQNAGREISMTVQLFTPNAASATRMANTLKGQLMLASVVVSGKNPTLSQLLMQSVTVSKHNKSALLNVKVTDAVFSEVQKLLPMLKGSGR